MRNGERETEQTAGLKPGKGATFRAVALAFLLMPFNALWLVALEIVRYSGQPTTISIFYNVVFLLVVLSLFNRLLKRFKPGWAFTPGELITVYVMLCLASALGGHDMAEVITPILSHGTQFANESNQWATKLLPHFPDWLIVKDKQAVQAFYSGATSLYHPAYLKAWALPIVMWSLFFSALTGIMLMMNLLLRKQWTQSERLAYPLIQLPMEIVSERSPLFRQRLFWAGCMLAAGIDCWNGLNMFVPSLPVLQVKAVDYNQGTFTGPWSAIGWLPIAFFPFAIGLGFLLPVDLLFSCWFFFWFWKMQAVVSAWMGWNAVPRFPYVNEQSFGGYMAIAALTLWSSRSLWSRVWDSVKSGMGDEDEPLRYRTMCILLGLCVLFLWLFCWQAGMSGWVIGVFFLLYFALSLAITRMRAELGPPAHDLHHSGPDHLIANIATPQRLAKEDMAMFTLFFGFNRAYRAHPMPFQLEGLKMAEKDRFTSKGFVGAIWLACGFGALLGFWANLHLMYHHGAASGVASPIVPLIFGNEAWNRMDTWVNNPTMHETSVPAIGIGFLTAFVLGVIRQQVPGFPLHPVGYAVSSSWSLSVLWVPLLIAWVIKSTMLRIGGLVAYRRALPFFLGLIVGECVAGSFWTLLGLATGLPIYGFYPY
jgi:hypothetical protein